MYVESELPRGIQIGTEQCMSDMWQNFKSYHPHEHISIEHSMTNRFKTIIAQTNHAYFLFH